MLLYGNHVLLGGLVALWCLVLTSAPTFGNFDLEDNSITDVGIFLVSSVSTCCLEDQLWELLFVCLFSMTVHLINVWMLPKVLLALMDSLLVLKDIVCAPSSGAPGKLGINTVSFTANELDAAEREANELERSKQAEMESKAAENALLFRNLKTVLDSLYQARLKEKAGDALCRHQQGVLDMQRDLLVDKGNNALQMKAELQRTRDKLDSCQSDGDEMVDEIELLRSNIEELKRRTTRPSADAKSSKESIVKQHRWEDSVFFGLGYDSVMDGSNVCPVPGKAHLTANNGSAATLACTVSPSGSVVSSPILSKSSSSSIISSISNAPVSPPRTGPSVAASPTPSPCKPAPSPSQANAKTTSRKAKRGKRKQKKACNMPGRMPVGTPQKISS